MYLAEWRSCEVFSWPRQQAFLSLQGQAVWDLSSYHWIIWLEWKVELSVISDRKSHASEWQILVMTCRWEETGSKHWALRYPSWKMLRLRQPVSKTWRIYLRGETWTTELRSPLSWGLTGGSGGKLCQTPQKIQSQSFNNRELRLYGEEGHRASVEAAEQGIWVEPAGSRQDWRPSQ